MTFLELIEAYAATGQAQFIIATHSPILLSLSGAQIYSFDGPRVQEVRYEETEHYQVYRQFFATQRSTAPAEGRHRAQEAATEEGDAGVSLPALAVAESS